MNEIDQWRPTPLPHPVQANDVHIWRVDLNPPAPETILKYRLLLSEDERTRADRFHFERHRRRFIVARAVLRILLGGYLNAQPEKIVFEYGPQGKPYLSQNRQNQKLQFNISHSHEMALMAFTPEHEIGVDIEYLDRGASSDDIVRRFFAPAEIDVYLKVPEHQRRQAFFNCWTRKEAFIKAIGQGLSLPLNQFEVSLVPGAPAELLATHFDKAELKKWTFLHLEPGERYVGAAAWKGKNLTIKKYQATANSLIERDPAL